MSRFVNVLAICSALLALVPATGRAQGDRFELRPEDSVVVVGGTIVERLAMSGYLEALIQSAHPSSRISVRHVPWSADEVGFQPRELNVPPTEAYFAEHEVDVIIACFGMSESFAGPEGLAEFGGDLGALLDGYAASTYNGESPPRVVLVGPIAHEPIAGPFLPTAEVARHNDSVRLYVESMRGIAAGRGVRFVDLFDPSGGASGLTTNGIALSERGCWHYAAEIGRQLGWLGDGAAQAAPEASTALRMASWDKHYHFRYLYRPTNTEYVWGRRAEPFGVVNFPPEHEQLRRMIDARQRALWDMAKPTPEQLFAAAPEGTPVWESVPDSSAFPEDAWTPPEVLAQGTETSVGSTEILPPGEFLRAFTVADGYVVECFASEQEFPELQNPLAAAFDARHRLWVLCSPTYPHLLPGDQPDDRLLVFEDSDGDGRADSCTTFASGFGISTGFAIDVDGVYVAQAPDLLKFVDTDGDGAADRRELIASGFAMPDSHHQISAFAWSPDGGFVMHEGTFSSANIETPYGTRRGRDAAIWYFDPRNQRLDIVSHNGFPNPWGHAFDDYGASIMDATSGGSHHAMSHISTAFDYPRKPNSPAPVLNRGRPTAGNEILSSRHFPDDVRGSHLTTQSIGFHGVRWDRLSPGGSAWAAEPMPQDLLSSSDTNFRPVTVNIGPDGALYVGDWCNPLIGHMQYSVRDPRRDHTHGRIWRVRHESRPLVTPPTIEGASVAELLEVLRVPEKNTRHHARLRLQRGEPTAVLPALLDWLDALDPGDPLFDRLRLEALWIKHAQGVVDLGLATTLAGAPTAEVRAAAIRMVRRWLLTHEVSTAAALPLLEAAVRDADMRVRLEGVVASGFAVGPQAAAVAQIAAESDMDDALRLVLDETLVHLRKYGEPDSFYARSSRLRGLAPAELLAEPWDEFVAGVVLERADVAEADRRRALDTVAGARPAARLKAITDAVLWSPRPGETATALAAMTAEAAGRLSAPLEIETALRRHRSEAVRSLAAVWAIAAGGSLEAEIEREPRAAIGALAMAPDRRLSGTETRALRDAVEDGRLDPSPAVSLLVDRATDPAPELAWLGGLVRGALERDFDGWDRGHVLAMAGWKTLNAVDPDALPEDLGDLRIDHDAEAIARGRAIYIDEAIGCARCHGEHGEGLPGFPPLNRSPWVLGSGVRAASIVAHGLQGEVALPDGRTFRSAMAPLGANLTDRQISDVLTYIRTSWDNFAPPVGVAEVAHARETQGRGGRLLEARALLAAFPFASDSLAPPDPASLAALAPSETPGARSAGISLGALLGITAGFVVAVVGALLIILIKAPTGR